MPKPQIYINAYTPKLAIQKKQDGSAQRMRTACRTPQFNLSLWNFVGV